MDIDDTNFRSLYELSGDAIMLMGEDQFLHCNPATLETFRCPSIDVFCTKHPSDISPTIQPCGTDSRQLASQHLHDALEQGYKRFEWVHRRLNGEAFYTEVLLNPATWQGQKVVQAVVKDISDRKKMEDELIASRDQAQQAAMAKSEFLAVMSHEIRTPIHGVIASQELLLHSSLDNEQRENVLLSLQSAESLLNIIDQILDFSKIEAGKLEIEHIAFSATELISEIANLLQLKAEEKQLAFSHSVHHSSCEYISADRAKIRQILINLVANAIKFTDKGLIRLESKVNKIDDQKVDWVVNVIDTGIGLAPDKQASIFEQFSQADFSTTRKYGGTGLGLAISQRLARAMDGDIHLYSEPGKGSTFSLRLPASPATVDSHAQRRSTLTTARNYHATALVAEDNPVNQLLISKQLQRLGINVDIAHDGLQALEQYQYSLSSNNNAEPYNIVLMDVQMPNLNGIGATERLRSMGYTGPIVALTADVIKGKREQCLNAGMNDFLTKPFSMQQLVSTLDRFLSY